MTPSFSVIVPVLDGARYLEELLTAVQSQGHDVELLVVDSGSGDGSPAIARAAGAELIEIPQSEFGHGRTRNLAAGRTSGELICFLTQDATPVRGWLDAYAQAMTLAPNVGAAFGPHLPRPDTSPMIARELTDFFATFGSEPTLLGPGAGMFLSNVNACYRRACWEEIRFEDVAYSEDQAFARALHAHGWTRAYHPGAAVLHAHDYSPVGFMRRYFDEYRGLHRTTGHVEHLGVRSTLRDVRGLLQADRRWMRAQGWDDRRVRAATGRALVHHGTRKLAAAAGSRADKLPEPVQRALSLEGTGAATEPSGPVHRPARGRNPYAVVGDVAREGAVPLATPVPGMADAERLHIAVVIPPFRRGSGGHSTIYNLLTRLEERGHIVSTWLHDSTGQAASEWPGATRGNLREFFRPPNGPVFKGFEHWHGADTVIATGWDTVYPVQRLPHCRARVYLVQDHEPEFFATSAESVFAERTYREGLYTIAASPWLLDLVTNRYGGEGTTFQLGVDHDVYRPHDVTRRRDTVVFYARASTARRAVPLGLLALQELRARRPDVRFVLFGNNHAIPTGFDYEDLGVATPAELARAYSEATVGLSLSLTNYSLIPQEMLACGLPCVELSGRSIESVFGADGPLELAPADPIRLADALETLLIDRGLWERRVQAGLEFVTAHTWERAADEVEAGLRAALRSREAGSAGRVAGVPVAHTGVVLDDNARAVPADLETRREATERLWARLAPEDAAAIEAALVGEQLTVIEQSANEADRHMFLLQLGVWHRIPAVLEKTGLRPDQPPEDVHAMSRGAMIAGGSLYYADLLADDLHLVGARLEDVRRGLDFGCSSGRVVRALAAAYPDAEWFGADPNEPAIAWAREHLPGIDFRVSRQDPPLPYEDASFDVVFAVSIWSHFAEPAAIRWLAEMHRIIRPGGHLVFSTHGLHSIAHYARTGERSAAQLKQVREALYTRGHWFAPEFGPAGDWGVKHTEWGTAFHSPEWVARVALPAWSIEGFLVGQNADNQDMYILRRR